MKLVERGIPVTYICGDKGNASLAEKGIVIDALGHESITSTGILRTVTRGIYNESARQLVLKHVMRDDGSTIYHVHGWSKILSPSIFGPLMKVASRLVLHAHDYFLACPNGAFMDFKADSVCKRIPLSKDCLITNCDKRNYAQKLWRSIRQKYLFQLLSRKLPNRIITIHEGMDTNLERAGYPLHFIHTIRNPATAWCEDRVRVEANNTLFFVGQVTEEKGIDSFLKAITSIGCKAEVIGGGVKLEALKLEYPKIRFHGLLDRKSIAYHIQRARAVVVPSRYPEPFGLVIAEALMSGIPVVLPNSALLSTEVEREGVGVVYSAGDRDELESALRYVSELDSHMIETISLKAYKSEKLALKENEWISKIVDKYNSLIQDYSIQIHR